MSNEITFNEIRVGDRIRVRRVRSNGTVTADEFTVDFKDHNAACDDAGICYAHTNSRHVITITLLDRPAPPTPRVGDSLTPEQIMALPDNAVFLDCMGRPRVVKGPHTVGASGQTSRAFHNSFGGHYRLVYLPTEAGGE